MRLTDTKNDSMYTCSIKDVVIETLELLFALHSLKKMCVHINFIHVITIASHHYVGLFNVTNSEVSSAINMAWLDCFI